MLCVKWWSLFCGLRNCTTTIRIVGWLTPKICASNMRPAPSLLHSTTISIFVARNSIVLHHTHEDGRLGASSAICPRTQFRARFQRRESAQSKLTMPNIPHVYASAFNANTRQPETAPFTTPHAPRVCVRVVFVLFRSFRGLHSVHKWSCTIANN